MDNLNGCLKKMKEYINNKQQIPYEKLADEYNVDIEDIKSIEMSLIGMLDSNGIEQ